MGREVRMVPPGWEHPKNEKGEFIPLFEGTFSKDAANWDEEATQWEKGFQRSYRDNSFIPRTSEEDGSYSDWAGDRPKKENYMPEWAEGEATLLVMYETTSEGTPISPAFETPEQLARWLADNDASAFGDRTASYEDWLATCQRGWAVSAIMDSKGMVSGVEGLNRPGGVD